MKKILAIMLSLVLICTLFSCGGKDEDTSSNTIVINSAEDEASSVNIDDFNANDTAAMSFFEGDWIVTGVFQEAMRSDIFASEGLELESQKAIHIDPDLYESYSYHFENPSYTISDISVNEMYDYNFTTESIDNNFPDGITMLTIFGEASDMGNGVLFLFGNNIIKFGQGGHLYLCEKVDAQG